MSQDEEAPISFFAEQITFEVPEPEQTTAWLASVIEAENSELEELNYIFCDDAYLLDMNQQYLDHDTYTDVITFDYAEEEGIIEGDVFISVERVRDNATDFKLTFRDELHRVMVHGLLHLLGYGDKTNVEEKQMRQKEDFYLSLRPFSGLKL